MYCTSCGQPNKDNAKFCTSCGQPLMADNVAPSGAPAQQQPVFQQQPIAQQPTPQQQPGFQQQPIPQQQPIWQQQPAPQQQPAWQQQAANSINTEQLKAQAGKATAQVTDFIKKMDDTKVEVSGHKLSLITVAALVGCVLTVISPFLPYALKQTLMDTSDGWVFLIIPVVVAALVLLRKNLPAAIVSAITLFIAIYDLQHVSHSLGAEMMQSGAYLVIVGTLISTAATVIAFINDLQTKKKNPPTAPKPQMPQQ
ncbi:zinc ribbon domain-containing protein [Bifidobacterium sp. LC6]|uniref:Zinc ribbon domain-containing protein n=1 Tax=Bifidobacterium colobi TaxID=2809026 RepID=A0ABS5UWY8_9BIFI|nr:zinc ribbon domain-containing protein [Bifidobacterium colobi]MBT1175617.1 zinc ribbon domain-containing protein [Bifidobacterium colobi]